MAPLLRQSNINPREEFEQRHHANLHVLPLVMARHLQSARFQEHALRVLFQVSLFASGNGRDIGPKGIRAILAAMEMHENNVYVQEFGFMAVGAVAQGNILNTMCLIREGGLERLLQHMKAHEDSYGVQTKAAMMLYAICMVEKVPVRTMLVERGFVAAIKAALLKHEKPHAETTMKVKVKSLLTCIMQGASAWAY